MISEEKAELRRQIRQAVAEYLRSVDSPAEISAGLVARIEALDSFRTASTILLYSPLPDEPDISALIAAQLGRKRVLFPLVVGNELKLKEIHSLDELSPAYCGIGEPRAEAKEVAPEEVDFALIPGRAFTPDGHRLGRGKGFYDRLIPKLSRAVKVAPAFTVQLLPSIPADSFDACVDIVIF